MNESDDHSRKERDDVRCEVAVQTLKDVLWRFDETSEGERSIYDLLSYMLEDLLREGVCPACVNETVAAAYTAAGVDPAVHNDAGDSVLH